MTEKQKLYFKVTNPIFNKIYINEDISLEEIKETFSEYLPHSNKSERLFFESVVNFSDLDQALEIIKKSDAYESYKSLMKTSEKLNTDISIKPFLKENVIPKNQIIDKSVLESLALASKNASKANQRLAMSKANKENLINLIVGPSVGEARIINALEDVEGAVLDHKESTDETIDLHKQQIYELKGHTSQNEITIELHTKELKELETANRALKTQVSQLSEVVQLIIEHLEEARNQTGELADSNELLKKQIRDAEDAAKDATADAKKANKKTNFANWIAVISLIVAIASLVIPMIKL